MHTDDEIKAGYLLHSAGDESYFWAFVEMLAILEQDPKRAWRMTCDMIRSTSDEEILENIAAGPLEDILDLHGDEYIEHAEKLAQKNANFRKALGAVEIDQESNPEIYARVQKVLKIS